MTANTVPISITIKAGKREARIEREIEVEEIEVMVDSLGQEVSGKAMQTIIDTLEDEIQKRVPGNWNNVGRERRRAVLCHGQISYHRRIYQDEDGKRHKPLDEILGIGRYERNSQKVRELGSVMAAQSSYRLAAASLSLMLKTAISPSTIQRMVWYTGKCIAQQESDYRSVQAGKVAPRVLYGESDGVWIHLQQERQKRVEARVAVMYTDKKRVGKGRFGLENKLVMTHIGGQSLDWQIKLREWADQHYDLGQTELLVVGGDGNSWVRQSFDLFNLPQAHLLDRFHVKRALRQAFGHTLQVTQFSRRLFSTGFEAVSHELTACMQSARGIQKQRMQQCFNYLNHNQDALLDLDKRNLAHSRFYSLGSIEGNVDKLAVHRMKGRGCCWRLTGAEAMLAILRYKDKLQHHCFVYHPVTPSVRKANRVIPSRLSRSYLPPTGSLPIFQGCNQNEPWVRLLKSKMDFGFSLTRFF